MIERIGQIILCGFDTPEPSDEFLEFVGAENIGGVILFEENANPHIMAESSIKSIISAGSVIPFIAVDQEGGRVCRFRGAPAEFDAPSEYGRLADLELFAEQFGRAAYYLHSIGINLFFGPVADLRINPENRCLEGRTFGSNPARVIPFIEKAIKIANRAGILSCLKHFPGFGAAVNDPHQEIAVADYDEQTFLNRESLTFKAGIGAGADMVMTTHLLTPGIDEHPATVSERIIQKLLRERLGFDGIVITDDLLMLGAGEIGEVGERALKAFLAGHDILLFGRDFRAARAALHYIKAAYKKGLIDDDRLEASLDRISGIKSKLAAPVI